jgi:hypothetical protein
MSFIRANKLGRFYLLGVGKAAFLFTRATWGEFLDEFNLEYRNPRKINDP